MQSTYTYPRFTYRQSDEQRDGKSQLHPVVIIGAGPIGLTAALESDMMKYILPRVPNAVVNNGAMSLTQALNAKAKLNEHLAPSSDRYALVNSQQSVDVVTGTSTLFNNQTEIGRQYREGRMGRAAGFDWYETTTAPRFFAGSGTGYLVNGANQEAADLGKPGETQTLVVDTGTGSLVEGTSEAWRYMLVAGAVTGGGLTVIANAPNPAGFAILKNHFPDGSISSGRLFLSALGPTLVAALMFLLPV